MERLKYWKISREREKNEKVKRKEGRKWMRERERWIEKNEGNRRIDV